MTKQVIDLVHASLMEEHADEIRNFGRVLDRGLSLELLKTAITGWDKRLLTVYAMQILLEAESASNSGCVSADRDTDAGCVLRRAVLLGFYHLRTGKRKNWYRISIKQAQGATIDYPIKSRADQQSTAIKTALP